MNKPKLKMPDGCNSIEISKTKEGPYGKEYEILYGWRSMDSLLPEDAYTRWGK